MTDSFKYNIAQFDDELRILESIYAHEDHVRQRELARRSGLSLGLTNTIVKRLTQKGWLTIRRVNSRNIHYVVSPAGVEQIARRSYRYFRGIVRSIVLYREAIERFVAGVKRNGFEAIVFVGRSDLDFVVEYACKKCELAYLTDDEEIESAKGKGRVFTLYAESYVPEEETSLREVAFLQEIVSGSPFRGRLR